MVHTPDIKITRTSEQFAARRLGEEIALFNVISGQTHLLDASLAAVFDLLSDTPKTKDALIAEATPKVRLCQDDIDNFIDQALLELQDIGLIDIAESP